MSEYPNVSGTYTEPGVGGWKGKINGQSCIIYRVLKKISSKLWSSLLSMGKHD
jgi:hypothetical protein